MDHRHQSATFQEETQQSYDRDSFQVTQEEIDEEEVIDETIPSHKPQQPSEIIGEDLKSSLIDEGGQMMLKELKKHIKDDDEDQYDEESFIVEGEHTIKREKVEVETRTSVRGSLVGKKNGNEGGIGAAAKNEESERRKKESISTINTMKNGVTETISNEIKRNAQLAGVLGSNAPSNQARASLGVKSAIKGTIGTMGKPPALITSQKPANLSINKLMKYPIKSSFPQTSTSQARTHLTSAAKNHQQQGEPSRPMTGVFQNKPIAGNQLNSDLKSKMRIHSSQGISSSFQSSHDKRINDRASTAATSFGQFQNNTNFQRSGTNFKKFNVAPSTAQSSKLGNQTSSSRIDNIITGKTTQSNFTNSQRQNSVKSGLGDRIKVIMPPFKPSGQRRTSTSMSSTNRSGNQTHTNGFNHKLNQSTQAQQKPNNLSQSQTRPFYQRQEQKTTMNLGKQPLGNFQKGRNSNLIAQNKSNDKFLVKSQSASRTRIQSAQVRPSFNHNVSASKQNASFGRNSFYGNLNMSASKGNLSNRSLSGTMNNFNAGGLGGLRIITNSKPPDINNLEKHVKNLKISDYYDPHPESLIDKSESHKLRIRPSSSVQALQSLQDPLNGKGNLLDYDFPIKILDNLIKNEEEEYGFSLFNRGQELKKSLIDTSKVKDFISKYQHDDHNMFSQQKQSQVVPSAPKNEKQDWNEVMNYFKSNPKALLDAIPTPRGEEEKALKDFKNGFLHKAEMDFRLNDTHTSGFGYKPRNSSAFDNYKTSSSGLNTPSRRLQSPKFQPTLNSTRKLNESSTKIKETLTLNRSSSRKSISSPYKNQINSKTFMASFKGERDLHRNFGNARLGGLTSNSAAYNDDPYQNLTTDENFNLNQTTESSRQKDFRISTNQPNKNFLKSRKQVGGETRQQQQPLQSKENNADRVKNRRQLNMLEEQKKEALDRKQQQEKIKSKIKKDYLKTGVELGGGNARSPDFKGSIISIEQQQSKQSAAKIGGKSVVEYIDWKDTRINTDYVLKKVNCRQIMDSKEFSEFLKEDEIDYIKLLISRKLKDPKMNQGSPEIVKICDVQIPRAYNTVEYLLKELLTENFFTLEFDQIFIERNFEGSSYKKLHYLLDKVRTLFTLRDQAISFLSKISDREQVLKEMKETVMNLHSDEQIEQHYAIKGLTQESDIPERPSRDKIQELGDCLIDCTEEVLKSLKRFYTQFNSCLEFVHVQNFLYDNADYRNISIREVKEIREVFTMFDIEIRELQNVTKLQSQRKIGITNAGY